MMPAYIWRPSDFDTRLCQAKACPNDADGFWGLCTKHSREQDAGIVVVPHVNPPPGEPSLWCTACHQDKPDAQFNLNPARPNSRRRGRYHVCKTCEPRIRLRDQNKKH